MKISRTALLAVSIADDHELDIRCAKRPSGLGRTLSIFPSLGGQFAWKCHFRGRH